MAYTLDAALEEFVARKSVHGWRAPRLTRATRKSLRLPAPKLHTVRVGDIVHGKTPARYVVIGQGLGANLHIQRLSDGALRTAHRSALEQAVHAGTLTPQRHTDAGAVTSAARMF